MGTDKYRIAFLSMRNDKVIVGFHFGGRISKIASFVSNDKRSFFILTEEETDLLKTGGLLCLNTKTFYLNLSGPIQKQQQRTFQIARIKKILQKKR